MKLKQRPMAGVGVRQKHGVRQMLAQQIRVSDWNQDVEHAVHHKTGLADFAELCKALAAERLPGAKGGELSLRNFGARYGLAVSLALVFAYNNILGRLAGERQIA